MNRLLTIIISLVLVSILNAQEIENKFLFQKFTIEDGLSQSTVECILQDRLGFMWFGTDDGLNRFNGYTFTNFRYDPADEYSISDNYIYDMVEDTCGYIWFGTNKGLNKYDPNTEKFKHYFHIQNDLNSLSDNIVHSVEVDERGNLWVTTLNNGLNIYSDSTDSFISVLPVFNEELIKMISKISILDDGYLYLGTFSCEAYKAYIKNVTFNTGNPQNLNFEKVYSPLSNNKENENIIWDFDLDKEGSLWICTNGSGLIKINEKTNQTVQYNIESSENFYLNDNSTHCAYIDSNGTIWVGAETGGINYLEQDEKIFKSIKSVNGNSEGLNDNAIWSIFEDRSGCMWFGTEFGGINMYNPNKVKFQQIYNPKGNNQIWSLYEDARGIIWIGTDGGGLSSFDPAKNKFLSFKSAPSNSLNISSNVVSVILEDNDNNLWIGTEGGGLNKFRPINNSFKRFLSNPEDDETISGNDVVTAIKSYDGKFWVSSYGNGISLFNPNTEKAKRFFKEEDSVKIPEADFTYALLEHNGVLWVGSYGRGLIRYEIESRNFRIFNYDKTDSSSLSNDKVISIFIDSKDNLWIGTARGLNRINEKENNFTVFTVEDGLPNDVIYSILEDELGNLWLGTNKGLSKFNPENKSIQNFTIRDGLQGYEFNRGAVCKLRNGDMLFGGINGFNIIPSKIINQSNESPKVILTSFKKMNEEIKFDKSLTFIDTVFLDYNESFFSFGFAALDYKNSGNIEYAYKLEGFHDDWIYAGKNRTANFTHLDPGKYSFKVRTSTSSNIWMDSNLNIAIIISPPFWATWWFRLILLLTFLSIGPLIYYRRVTQLKKDKILQVEFSKQLIQSQESERRRIASELHDSLGQDLLVIKNLALLNKKTNEHSDEISKTAGSAIDEVRRISYNLHPYQLDRLGLTKAIRSMFVNIEGASSIKFDLLIDDVDNLFDKEKEINIYRIIQECVNNIIKHSKADEAKVMAKKQVEELVIEIADNGKGFNFETAKLKSNGFGLKNLENRVSFLGGEIKFGTSGEYKTKINITIPIENNEQD